MFRRCGGFFPLLLTFFIVASIFVSTLNASLSHQELSAAPREKRFESGCFYNGQKVPCDENGNPIPAYNHSRCLYNGQRVACDENGNPIPPTDNLVKHDKIIASGLSHQELSADPREKRDTTRECTHNKKVVPCGAENIGYGIGLLVASLFAYLFFH